MPFDFDTPVERRGTGSIKWDRYTGRDVIPLWVADMEFRTAPAVITALRRRVEHGVFGYTHAQPELAETVVTALSRDHGFAIDPRWLVWLPSLVVGLNVVSRAFAGPGEEVLTSVPIYPPFMSAPEYGDRRLLKAPLAERDGRWSIDLEALERVVTPRTKLLLWCSPHNPTGRVWARDELSSIAQWAARHDVTVVSDEIHCGLVLDRDAEHIPFATLDAATSRRTVTLMSASKTFNLPTLGCAFAIVENPSLRAKLERAMSGIVHHPGALGYEATRAAFAEGRAWQLELLDYLRENRDLVERAIANMPGLRSWHVEATYLTWIDARQLGVRDPAGFFEDAGVGLFDGAVFDAPGFVRLNFACPRAQLTEALERMRSACEKHVRHDSS